MNLSGSEIQTLQMYVALMPAGKRRDGLHENLEKRRLPVFTNPVPPFDMACTKAYAELLAKSRPAGLTVETTDAFIVTVDHPRGLSIPPVAFLRPTVLAPAQQ